MFPLEANKLQSSHKCVKPFGMARSLVFTRVRCREDSLPHPHLGVPLSANSHCLQACLHWLGRGWVPDGGWVSKHPSGHPGAGVGAELPGQSRGLPGPETGGVGRRWVSVFTGPGTSDLCPFPC